MSNDPFVEEKTPACSYSDLTSRVIDQREVNLFNDEPTPSYKTEDLLRSRVLTQRQAYDFWRSRSIERWIELYSGVREEEESLGGLFEASEEVYKKIPSIQNPNERQETIKRLSNFYEFASSQPKLTTTEQLWKTRLKILNQ